MKWLLDANLSYRLVRRLAQLSIEIVHVSRSALPNAASDEERWKLARQ
jgi:predicted nuclease of predicted toxin-antitoxin system